MGIWETAIGFAGFFKTREIGSAKTDNIPFRLHYNFTSGFLFLATALLAMTDLIGKNIQCHSNVEGPSQLINQYCWVTGTYTVPGLNVTKDGLDENMIGVGMKPQKCVLPDLKTMLECDPDGTCRSSTADGDLPRCAETQSYYQWVPFILIFQGLLFMIPNKIWEVLEEGKMKSITDGVRLGTSMISDEKAKEATIKNIAKFVHRQNKSSGHVKYAYGFLTCMILSLLNVVFNFCFLDHIFKGKFKNLGIRWIEEHFEMENRILKDIFPRMTACVWKDFGTGNREQYKNYVCILAANILNEKIFIFLWYWYILLGIITFFSVIYYTVLIARNTDKVRSFYLQYAVKSKSKMKEAVRGSVGQRRADDKGDKIKSYLKRLPRSNFFFLYSLAHNVEFGVLGAILRELAVLDSSPPTYRDLVRSHSLSPSSPSKNDIDQGREDSELIHRSISFALKSENGITEPCIEDDYLTVSKF